VSDTRPSYDEQLPWLQPVEDEDEPRGVSARKMLAALVVVLLAGVIVAATFFWLGRRDETVGGPPELIRAEPGPYKIKPANPGGLDVAGESQTAFETSAGEDKDAQLDLNALPEQPVAKPAKEEPQRIPSNETKVPAEPAAEPKPAGPAGSVIQLGAFQNQASGTRVERFIGALPDYRRNEQADHTLPRRHPASRRRHLAGGGEAGVPGAQSGRRKLLRRALGRFDASRHLRAPWP